MSIVALTAPEPPRLLLLPFFLLLGAIAVAPLVLRTYWERHYLKVCFGLPAIVIGYYFAVRDFTAVRHALLDYSNFVVVIASFFTVAGGIHLRARTPCRPLTNTIFLLIGALLANVFGTIGASVILIRPWIEMNKTRFAGYHLAFFIFIVSNIGGALLPVGPPLFLGFQKGIPFPWPLTRLWPHWLFVNSIVLIIFFLIDRLQATAKGVQAASVPEPDAKRERWRIFGKRNLGLMIVLLFALIFLPPPLNTIVMILTGLVSYFTSPRRVHEANGFTFLPLLEVAALFFGIFGTIIPVITYLELHAHDLGITGDRAFFWATGVLSAMLDNAPTYLTFLAGSFGLHNLELNNSRDVTTFVAQHDRSLIAISLGATFFGALTYVGNGPNLLVKAIAEARNVSCPTFFGFIFKYAVPVLVPVFALLSIFFFRG